jgi:putative aminopeptidase FrvX
MTTQDLTHKNRAGGRPRFGAAQLRLLERLCNACAVSGDESEVRLIVLEQLKEPARSQGGEVRVDALGNVLVSLPGSGSQSGHLRVMLAAHMDEVGFMVTQEDEEGIYRFETVGGIDVRQIVGKPVWIGHQHLPGVIGAKPIHLTKDDEELKELIPVDTLRIDTGLGKTKVQVGERATFATPFIRLGSSLRGKALDNRLGVSVLIELVKNAPANIHLLAAFTVQEEIGGRGARVAAYDFNPDLAIALDSTPAYDLPSWDDTENAVYNSRLGSGPAIYLADAGTLSDPRLIRHLAEAAEADGIPYQFRQPGGGGTDAGAIHKQRLGIPSVSVSVPSRYQHTAASIGRISDWQNTVALLQAALRRVTPDLLASDRS